MMDAAQRAPMRRLFYAAYIAMRSVEVGVHHAAMRYARGTGGLVRAKLWFCMTRRDACREAGYLRWVAQPPAYMRRSPRMWPATVLLAAPPLTEQGPTAVDARTTGVCFDVTAKLRIGIRAVYLTVAVLAHIARPRGGRHHGRR